MSLGAQGQTAGMKVSNEQFEKLALEQIDLLYRVARRLARNESDAGDLVQETYLRAFRASDTFNLEERGIRPWLVRILQNIHFTKATREKRQPVAMESAPLEAAARPGTPDPYAWSPDGWDGMDERLAKALKDLPREYQVVLLLWAIEEFSYKEIAEATDVPIGTVMSRLHRARQRLGEILHDYAVQEGVIRE